MATSSTSDRGGGPPALRLLSLDGGGIRGLSELTILEELMHRVKTVENLPHEPLPADYFDMICGTSTGGLIALLLGRLRFSVSEAISQYGRLAEKVFSKKKRLWQVGTFKAFNSRSTDLQDICMCCHCPECRQTPKTISDMVCCKKPRIELYRLGSRSCHNGCSKIVQTHSDWGRWFQGGLC